MQNGEVRALPVSADVVGGRLWSEKQCSHNLCPAGGSRTLTSVASTHFIAIGAVLKYTVTLAVPTLCQENGHFERDFTGLSS